MAAPARQGRLRSRSAQARVAFPRRVQARSHRCARSPVSQGAGCRGSRRLARWLVAGRPPEGSTRDGRVVALDILAMEPLAGVEFIQGDFRSPEVRARLEASVGRREVDLVLSDMAPNLTGMRASDQARWLELAESAQRFASTVLDGDGALLVKMFQGGESDSFLRTLRERFASVAVRKPAASRKHSAETYALARGPIRESSPT